jgi:hypothetical protein
VIRRRVLGSSPYGLVRYLFSAGRANDHDNPHVIASWDGQPEALQPEFVAAIGHHDVTGLTRVLSAPVVAALQPPDKYVYHLIFRAAPEDRHLDDAEWAELCVEAMDRTGIAKRDDPAGCRWIAVRHADDHVHLVATLVREDGRTARTPQDFRKLAAVAHEFETSYGLRSTAAREDQTAAARPGVQETAAARTAGRERTPRETLRTKVKAAAARTAGFKEFADLLGREGVTVWPRMSERSPGEITGYSVSLNDYLNGAGEPVRFGGGKLAPDLSWPKLASRWSQPAPEIVAPSAGDQAATEQPASAAPRFGDEDEAAWREAERIVREAAERITASAATDPDLASDAAWATADALAAAAAGLERDEGGPLTDAALAFDRAGRDSFRRTPVRTDTGQALRSVGRMVGMLALSSRQPKARAAVLSVAMSSLVAAVADLRTAQQRQHQAEAALATAVGLRQVAPISVPGVAVFAGAASTAGAGGRPPLGPVDDGGSTVRPPQTGPAAPATAADIARRSVGSGFKLTRPKPAEPGKPVDPPVRRATRERGPHQGR